MIRELDIENCSKNSKRTQRIWERACQEVIANQTITRHVDLVRFDPKESSHTANNTHK